MDSKPAVGPLFPKHPTKCGQRLPRRTDKPPTEVRPRAFLSQEGAGQESDLFKPWTPHRKSSVSPSQNSKNGTTKLWPEVSVLYH